jgi:hypothetical protein
MRRPSINISRTIRTASRNGWLSNQFGKKAPVFRGFFISYTLRAIRIPDITMIPPKACNMPMGSDRIVQARNAATTGCRSRVSDENDAGR